MENLKLVCREEEAEYFVKIVKTKEASFLAVYGRRRTGKTYLIREVFGKRTELLEVLGVKDGDMTTQIDKAMKSYEDKYEIKEKLERPKSWGQFFEKVTRKLNQSKGCFTLFLDEIQWLASKRSNLLSELEYFWNKEWSQYKNFNLVICGSSSSWILEKVINNTGGLHNRITDSLNLKPLNLTQTKEYLEFKKFQFTKQQILEVFISFGGIPYYLNLLDRKLSPMQNIQRLMFESQDIMRKEADILFEALFTNHKSHELVIKELMKKRTGLSREEIKKTSKIPSGTLELVLKELVTSSFVREYVPIGNSKKGAYFKLVDEYLIFYNRWLKNIGSSPELVGGERGCSSVTC